MDSRITPIDPALAEAGRPVFSDYQHVTKAVLALNQQFDELREIDKDKQPNWY